MGNDYRWDGALEFLADRLQTMEATRAALASDLSAIRLAILKGPQMSPSAFASLAGRLAQTQLLLTAATRAYAEIILSIAGRDRLE